MDERESLRKKAVVVVGGGIAGALVAKSLQFDAEVILIDPKEYLEIPWAELRSTVEPNFANRSLINHTDYLTNGRIINSVATEVTDRSVLTADGNLVLYDYLVITTGHSNFAPISRKDRLLQFQRDKQKIVSSQSILIIGGGPTGVELAGEIATEYPNKTLTLIHKGPRLLEFISKSASNKTLDWLISRKVNVILNQSVNLSDLSEMERIYLTSNGEKVTADCHFICVGKPVGSNWLEKSVLSESLDERGRLMVDKNLRVRGFENIFAAGDITDIPEMKQGYLAQRQAMVVVKNLKKLVINEINEGKLVNYTPSCSPIAIVSLGKRDGLAQFPFCTLIGCLPGQIKSRDLFVSKTRKTMGLNA